MIAFHRSSSILVRTALILITLFALTGGLFIALTTSFIRDHSYLRAHTRLEELLNTVEKTVSIACYLADKPLAKEVAEGLMNNRDVASVSIHEDSSGEILVHLTKTVDSANEHHPAWPPLTRIIRSPFAADTTVGNLVLQPDVAEIDREVDENVVFVKNLLFFELVTLGAVFVTMVLSMVIRPIKQVSVQLHSMNAADGEQLLIPHGHDGDEIGSLVTDINSLATDLVAVIREEQTIRQQWQEGEKKYHAIFDNADAGICLLKYDGQILSFNQAFERMTGLAPNTDGHMDLTNMSCDIPNKIALLLTECLLGNESLSEHIKLSHSDTWLHLILTPINSTFVQCVISDVTELTLAKQKVEEVSHAKSEFLASISHELRTPLNAILGYSQLLSLGQDYPEIVKNQAAEITQSGSHLLSLINDIIDLTSIEAGRIELFIEPVSIKSVVNDALTMIGPLAQVKRIRLINEIDLNESVVVDADYGRLRQALMNFLSNAIKYNEPNGEVILSYQYTGECIRLHVTDTGEGVPASQQNRLFNSFDRLGKECSAIDGIGIGLVVAKSLVEAMHGQVGFNSVEGLGSTFWLEFPQGSVK
ncbi:MAG: ATP-binding protein [Gammaproteobacteria bacterium]